ncbi:MAG: tetratricopeptide domain-containing [Geobacteraceae bacterium]|nr:MAG: tetratricopeptide domain-containing [Geobacteraceae bacterium]
MRLEYGLLVAVCLAISGCGGNDVIVKKQMEMEARLEQLVQGNVAANARLTELSGDLKEVQNQVRNHAASIEELKPGYIELKSSLEAIAQKTADPPPLLTPKIEVVNREAPAADKDAAPQDAYMKAFGLFSANNYVQAVEAFESFIRTYPDSEYAGNAQYWIGECHYTQRNYPQALDAFDKVIANYPKGKKVPDAMLKFGYTLIGMNEQAKAKVTLQSLIEKYPKSHAAVKAREKLGRL